MQADKSLDGIISYLTKEHGGNVHEKGIVAINSKSLAHGRPSYVGIRGPGFFISQNEPNQWISWDFRKMRVRPTHYTIQAGPMKSWVVEGSLDGTSWTEIDRRTDIQDFPRVGWWDVSFALANAMECRFIRLTQTSADHKGRDELSLCAAEFFGTLSE
jgi:hypothetical protein